LLSIVHHCSSLLSPKDQNLNNIIFEWFPSYDKIWTVKPLLVYIGYKEGLNQEDIPKSFKVYFTAKHDWHGLVTRTWTGYQYPFQIDTALYNLPLEVQVKPLSRIYHFPLQSKVDSMTSVTTFP
jgi:hypothetical protein